MVKEKAVQVGSPFLLMANSATKVEVRIETPASQNTSQGSARNNPDKGSSHPWGTVPKIHGTSDIGCVKRGDDGSTLALGRETQGSENLIHYLFLYVALQRYPALYPVSQNPYRHTTNKQDFCKKRLRTFKTTAVELWLPRTISLKVRPPTSSKTFKDPLGGGLCLVKWSGIVIRSVC